MARLAFRPRSNLVLRGRHGLIALWLSAGDPTVGDNCAEGLRDAPKRAC